MKSIQEINEAIITLDDIGEDIKILNEWKANKDTYKSIPSLKITPIFLEKKYLAGYEYQPSNYSGDYGVTKMSLDKPAFGHYLGITPEDKKHEAIINDYLKNNPYREQFYRTSPSGTISCILSKSSCCSR